MEGNLDPSKQILSTEVEEKDVQFEQFFQTLPKRNNVPLPGILVAQYKGFWFDKYFLENMLAFRKHFQPNDSDIILVSVPKAGTTWLKALTFSIVNRNRYSISESPLLSSNPHQLVPFFEMNIYECGKVADINSIPSPRIFATHTPYQCLPSTILCAQNCRIIYLCRNPLDVFTSGQHFILQNDFVPKEGQSLSMDECFESFCEGTYIYGPFWDHILGYWEASLHNHRILFLKYEDLVKDTNFCVKKMAEFLGGAFSVEEQSEGLVEEIAKLCSLENLKNLECNQKGETSALHRIKHSSFFRKGEVGDWVNFLQPSMAERIEKLMKEKFGDSGLAFDIHG